MQDLLARIGININVSFHLIFLGLIWTRVLAMSTVVPFLFSKPVPKYVTTAASLALAVFIYSHTVPSSPPALSENMMELFMLYLKEAFYGFTMGLSVAGIFYGFEAAGSMIDNQRGLSIARTLIPQLGEQGSLTGSFLFQLALVVYLTMGGHLAFLDTFSRSFVTLPVLSFPVAGPGMLPLMDLFVRISGEVLYMSIQLAAPIIIAIFIADIILSVANRVAPQINVWELGFNVKGYVGILLLFISITIVGDQMKRYLTKSTGYEQEVVQDLEGQPPVTSPSTGDSTPHD